MCLYERHRHAPPPPQKILKIRVSKMAISCILRRIPCLSATVKWGIAGVIFQLKHVIYVGKHFIHNSCSFSTCFTSHLFVICWNHGMKIKILLVIGRFYQKCRVWTQMQVFTKSRWVSRFICSNAGQSPTHLAWVSWCLWVYGVRIGKVLASKAFGSQAPKQLKEAPAVKTKFWELSWKNWSTWGMEDIVLAVRKKTWPWLLCLEGILSFTSYPCSCKGILDKNGLTKYINCFSFFFWFSLWHISAQLCRQPFWVVLIQVVV